jgi:dsRNA-specific ribonuclease
MAAKRISPETLKEAWIGDAVLTLYVRRRILAEQGAIDGGKAERMTSNRFLSTFGEPSRTEAEIGRLFEASGLEAAYAWIDQHLLPLFEKQESKRLPRGPKPNSNQDGR